jgi:vacuolar-type H+-ATPase subunit I/STV1
VEKKRYLVVIQGAMFVFGIVGPIFLIVYFAAQPDPTLKWMCWFGLFITAADVLIALAITNGSTKSIAKKESK